MCHWRLASSPVRQLNVAYFPSEAEAREWLLAERRRIETAS
jgi:hypothetical protein